MKTKTNTKRALISSLFSFALLAGTMVLGGTFAWFTSSARNSDNKIKAGTLEVQLYQKDGSGLYQNISTDPAPIFNAANMEPSDVISAELMVVNSGTIELKYGITLVGLEVLDSAATKNIQNVLDVYIDGAYKGPLSTFTSGEMSFKTGSLTAQNTEAFTIDIILWEEAGNEFQGGELPLFDIVLSATQATNIAVTYKEAGTVEYSRVSAPIQKTGDTILAAPSTTGGDAVVTLPEGAIAGSEDKSAVLNVIIGDEFTDEATFSVGDADDTAFASITITLLVGGEKVTQFNDYVTVAFEIAKGLDSAVVNVFYNGVGEAPRNVQYDPSTGIVTFETKHFSQFIVTVASVIVTNSNELASALAAEKSIILLSAGEYTANITISYSAILKGINAPVITGEVRVTGANAVMSGIIVRHTYVATRDLVDGEFRAAEEHYKFDVYGENFTFTDGIIERASYVTMPYGYLINYRNDKGTLTIRNSQLNAPCYVSTDPTVPFEGQTGENKVIYARSISAIGVQESENNKLIMKESIIATNGYGIFTRAQTAEYDNVKFTGIETNAGYRKGYMFINATNLYDVKINSCDIESSNYGLLVGCKNGSAATKGITITNSSFKSASVAIVIGLWGSDCGNSLIEGNTMDLSANGYGIRAIISQGRTLIVNKNTFKNLQPSNGDLYCFRNNEGGTLMTATNSVFINCGGAGNLSNIIRGYANETSNGNVQLINSVFR